MEELVKMVDIYWGVIVVLCLVLEVFVDVCVMLVWCNVFMDDECYVEF